LLPAVFLLGAVSDSAAISLAAHVFRVVDWQKAILLTKGFAGVRRGIRDSLVLVIRVNNFIKKTLAPF